MFDYKKIFSSILSKNKNEVSMEIRNEIRTRIKIYFDGFGDHYDAEADCRLSSLGVTNLEFKKEGHIIKLIVTLTRPGMLIGKAGRTIDRLTELLSMDYPVKIDIIESKLWNREY